MKYFLLLNLINFDFVRIFPLHNSIRFMTYDKRCSWVALSFYNDLSLEDKLKMIEDFKSVCNENRKKILHTEDILAIIERYTTDNNVRIRFEL